MGGPRVTINAAMFTAAVGVDGTVKGNIGRLIARDDGLGCFSENLSAQLLRLGQRFPAVIDIGLGLLIKPRAGVYPRTAPALQLGQGGEFAGA